jgi:hypothetical protein
VISARRRYGVLAIDERGGIFSSQAQSTLETYAQLAAAALDAADAMEDARHQANTARVLLELSTSLAEIVGTEEMAAKVAWAVPDVIDCDRVAVFLDDADWQGAGSGEFRLVARSAIPMTRWPLCGRGPTAKPTPTRSPSTASSEAWCPTSAPRLRWGRRSPLRAG